MNQKKSKLIYKLLTTLTLSMPITIYMFLSATLFNINPDYEIRKVTSASISVVHFDDYTFIYTDDVEAILDGTVVNYNGKYGFYMEDDDILKLKDGYFNNQLQDIKTLEVQKQTSWKLPITFFISLMGVGIVALIINGKLQWHKDHPKEAVLIALITSTVILLILNTFISNILNVFIIASASWALFLIESKVHDNKLTQEKANRVENDIISSLKEALK